jgi:putative MATE family efflux protein
LRRSLSVFNRRRKATLELEPSSASLTRTVLTLATPAIGESLLSTMVLFANTLFLGRLQDDVTLAAVGLGSTFIWIANGLFRSVGVAATAMVARFVGRKDLRMATRVAAQAVVLGTVSALGTAVIGMLLSDNLLRLMGAEPEVVRQGSLYMNVILASSILSFPTFVAGGVMRGAGDTRTPMWIALIQNVWNIVVGYLLIFGVGPLPTLGLLGAGLATSTAGALAGCLALGALLSGRTALQVEPRSLFIWDGTLAWRIVRLALPNLAREGVSRTGHILFMRIVAALGTAALAAHQIAVRVESLSYMPGWGFSLAAATLVGQSLGRGEEDAAVAAVQHTAALACGVMGAIGLGFAFFSHPLVAVFGANQQTLRLAGAALQIAALEQVPIALNMVLSAAFQGAGDTRTPMYVTLFGVLIFRVAVVYAFAIALGWGLRGVWLGTAADWAGRALLTVVLFRRGRWREASV